MKKRNSLGGRPLHREHGGEFTDERFDAMSDRWIARAVANSRQTPVAAISTGWSLSQKDECTGHSIATNLSSGGWLLS